MGDHFAGDFGESRDAALDVEEGIFVEVADVAGGEPAVFGEDFLGFFFVVEVAGEDVCAFEDDDSGFVEGEGLVG